MNFLEILELLIGPASLILLIETVYVKSSTCNKQEYFNNLLINDAKRPKQRWKTLKTWLPNGKNTTTSVKRLFTEYGTDVSSPKGS